MRNLLIVFTALTVWGAGVIAPWFIVSPKDPAMLAVYAFGVGLWSIMSALAAIVTAVLLSRPAPKTKRAAEIEALASNFFKKEQS